MTADKRPSGIIGETIAGLKRLPDTRAAIEGVLLFIMVVGAGAWAVSSGVLILNPIPHDQVLMVWVSAFVIPTLGEELVFRGWVKRGAPWAAVASLFAYILWHPLQTWLGLPFGRPEFTDPRFLGLIAWLGLACTLARLRSGSLWPPIIIHWGVVVLWKALFSA